MPKKDTCLIRFCPKRDLLIIRLFGFRFLLRRPCLGFIGFPLLLSTTRLAGASRRPKRGRRNGGERLGSACCYRLDGICRCERFDWLRRFILIGKSKHVYLFLLQPLASPLFGLPLQLLLNPRLLFCLCGLLPLVLLDRENGLALYRS